MNKRLYELLKLALSTSGFVPQHATVARTVVMLASAGFALCLDIIFPNNSALSVAYFLVSTACYIGFIYLVLPRNGLRHWFVRLWGSERKGYLAFEATLGFLFFHNGASIGFLASSFPGRLFASVDRDIVVMLVTLLFTFGVTIKLWSAKVVSTDIYYWKDMFLGRKVCEFVVDGPYKYFQNPMYGLGQLQAYAIAIWYGSPHGIIAALVNQCAVFSFYYLVERKFIERVYLNVGIAELESSSLGDLAR